MWITYIGPTAMLAISLWSAAAYAVKGMWLHAVYWAGAAIVTAAVTAMGDNQ